jgi:acyl carrier protein
VPLKALPLTANGKVDRQALPAPEPHMARPAARFVAPRNAVEEVLTDIWSDVLGRAEIGVHDNFFELGGHSLLSIQVLSRVRQAFRTELPPRELFDTPTVAGLAEALRKYEAQPGQIATIARLRREIEQHSADDIQALLRDRQHTPREVC